MGVGADFVEAAGKTLEYGHPSGAEEGSGGGRGGLPEIKPGVDAVGGDADD